MSALYPLWKQELLKGTSGTNLTGTTKVSLVDTTVYTYLPTHEFFSSLSGVLATTTLVNTSCVDGVFSADDVTFNNVPIGGQSNAIVIFNDTGNPATSRLVAYLNGNMTIVPNGGNISILWGTNGIFKL